MKVTIRCPFCRHIHAAYDYSDLYVFVPETLKKWANSECPICHRIGYEILIEAEAQQEYTDEVTGVRLIVNHDNPEYPDHPLITIICPPDNTLSIEQINEAMQRLQSSAGLSPQHRMPPLQWKMKSLVQETNMTL